MPYLCGLWRFANAYLYENKKRSCYGSSFYIKSGNCLSMIEQLQNPKEEVNYYE